MPPPVAQIIDKLVSRNCIQPGCEGAVRLIGHPTTVQGNQRFLREIVDNRAISEAPAKIVLQQHAHLSEERSISAFVSCQAPHHKRSEHVFSYPHVIYCPFAFSDAEVTELDSNLSFQVQLSLTRDDVTCFSFGRTLLHRSSEEWPMAKFSNFRKCTLAFSVSTFALLTVIGPTFGETRPLTVVELFTSQGCSSCPPANANLIRLKDEPNVLALSFSVTYWDYLGWKDIFGRKDYTARQETYEAPLGESGAFTPQMVVDGRLSLVGRDFAEAQSAIKKSEARSRDDAPRILIESGRVSVFAANIPSHPADVWLVRYDPHVVNVPIQRGENTGRTLPHANVVHELVHLGSWNGTPSNFSVAAAPAGQKTAILVQSPNGGPILAAATD